MSMTEFINKTQGLLTDLINVFEKEYVQPYEDKIAKFNSMEQTHDIKAKLDICETKFKFLQEFVHNIRFQIEHNTIREIEIAELRELLTVQRILKNGKCKVTVKEQIVPVLPCIEKIISV